MTSLRHRRNERRLDFWPGFVDAMATLLLVIIFLLSIFMLAQFFLSQQISGRDSALLRLNAQISELTELLALERAENNTLDSRIALLESTLTEARDEYGSLQVLLTDSGLEQEEGTRRAEQLESELEEEKQISRQALAQVEILNQQIAALRQQLGAIEQALRESEDRDVQSRTRIADLGRRLNAALAQRIQELSRYRSDFFGRLREILSERSDIRVVGDRFVFQSEVLFPSGSDQINPQGEEELGKLARAIIELQNIIPVEINWVLRVDGHTDNRPISGGRFDNNWELSAARAISVVRFLVDNGVGPERLVAAGFGEFQPIEGGETDAALARNRRIELKLTER